MHQEEANLKELLENVLVVEKPLMDRANVKVEAHFAPMCLSFWWTVSC